jgi:hypothetical protein
MKKIVMSVRLAVDLEAATRDQALPQAIEAGSDFRLWAEGLKRAIADDPLLRNFLKIDYRHEQLI